MKSLHKKWKIYDDDEDLYTISEDTEDENLVATDLSKIEADHIIQLHNDWLTTQDIEDENANDQGN